MSTIFALFKKGYEPKTTENGEIDENETIDPELYTRIAFRTSILYCSSDEEVIISNLPDDIPVFPLDNGAQGIYTIGDLKKELNNGKN